MTPQEIAIIRHTWAAVAPIADAAAQSFYSRLFDIDPSTRPLFKTTDMAEQRRKLMGVIGIVVGSLERLDTLIPTVENLGRRHTGYGVEDRHYNSVGAALLWTLEQGLGDEWSEDARIAWSKAYALLAGVMQSAAANATKEKAA